MKKMPKRLFFICFIFMLSCPFIHQKKKNAKKISKLMINNNHNNKVSAPKNPTTVKTYHVKILISSEV